MMMPYLVRREVPSVYLGAPHLSYNTLPNTLAYGHLPHPANVQLHQGQDPMLSNRPFFPAPSAPSLLPTQYAAEENLLRRKTPSGTLPAAYDAAPTEYISRPTKHILLPYQGGEGHHLNYDSGNQGLEWTNQTMGHAPGPFQQGVEVGNESAPMFTTDWLLQPIGQTLLDGNPDPYVQQLLLQQQQTGPPFPDPLWMNSQFSGFQPLYNPITQPTASCDEIDGFMMMGGNFIPRDNIWLSQQSTWGNGQSTPSQLPQAVDSMSLNSNYTHDAQNSTSYTWWDRVSGRDMVTPASAPQDFYLPPEPAPLHVGTGMNDFTMGYLGHGGVLQRSKLPTREKAALWAHKAYVELLAAIHAQQRQTDAQGNLAAPSAKAGLFPRPPKINGLKISLKHQAQTNPSALRFNSQTSAEISDRRKRMRPSVGGNTNYLDIGTSSSNSSPMSNAYSNHRSNSHINSGAQLYDANAMKHTVDFCSRANGVRQLSNGMPNNSPIALDPDSSCGISTSLTSSRISNAFVQATAALDTLEKICAESNWTGNWFDGMLLGGCLAHALGDLNRAVAWNRRILDIDEGHAEALSNTAITMLSLYRKDEAERYWRLAVTNRPSYFEAVEHLVGLLCGEKRAKDAVDIINYVESALRRPDYFIASAETSMTPNVKVKYEEQGYNLGQMRQDPRTRSTNSFMIPGLDNGRMLALIHAKGNMLYTLGDNIGAAKAFEDAVLVAAGVQGGDIQALIDKILLVLKAATESVNLSELIPNPPQIPVLLPPEKAVQTARLVFPPHGELPGLRDVPLGGPLKAAIATTSNSLLSLAKIFQDGMSSGGATVGRPGASVKDILALYYLSLSLHASPSTANNVGILLASIQQSSPSPSTPGSYPHHGPNGIGMALSYYNYGLQLDNRHAHLYTNLGSLLKDINQLPTAIKMYEQAVLCDPSFDIALANLANAVKDQGRISDAIIFYRRAVKANPEFAEAVCGLANALNSVCDWRGRGGIVKDGGNRDRWHVDESGMLRDAQAAGAKSSGWMKRVVEIVEKQLRQGESWGKHALAGDMFNTFLRDIEYAENGCWSKSRGQSLQAVVGGWVGQPYEGAKIIRLIERASQRAVWRWYQDKYVKGIDNPLAEYQRPKVPPSLATPSAPTVLPFHTFTCPVSAEQVRLISERNGLRISCSTLRSSWLAPHVYPPPSPPAPYLRVGYISSDFNNHPLAHLMQSVFGLHDQRRVKAYCYATTASDNSEHRKQIEEESPIFYDAHGWGPDRLVQQIVNDGIHILVNLNGFTRGARNEVFAARPAPIQMSFMGFAGTLGAEWCDYLYADTTAVPHEVLRKTRRNVDIDDSIRGISENGDNSWVYAENIIFARYTFFCCDHRQSAPDSKAARLGWDEEVKRRWRMRKKMFPELEDDQIILGNFNQLYKIEPTTFRTWLRILAAVPKAVLWLLRFPDLGESNLRAAAETWACKEVASRIIFTDVAPKPLHISRAQVCDLFLDTPECNAHTTAADVLWSGTPLLTLPRHKHKMCSRIAASILRAAVPQTEMGKAMANSLVADSDDDYERRAIELASDLTYQMGGEGGCTGELADIRKVLFTNRWTSELFNTKRWVSDLEDAYEEAWRRWVNGEGGDIDLKALKPRAGY